MPSSVTIDVTAPRGASSCSIGTVATTLLLAPLVVLPGCFETPTIEDTEGGTSSGTVAGSSTGSEGVDEPLLSTSSSDDGGDVDTGEPEPPPVTCGNGMLDPGEECDDGPANGPGAMCRGNCMRNVCGDADLSPVEGCDDGNTNDGDGCSATCHSESCGNGTVDESEECDDAANGDQDDGCTDLCRLPACGDGFEQPNEGELCDDGNNNNLDGCVVGCVPASCGDGYAWAGREACDDGNVDNTDACLVGCQAAACGDGHLHVGFEECDDDGNSNGDGCSASCQEEAGWSCDAGGCDTVCGDGIVAGDECCDDGNGVSGDMCPANCALAQRQVFVSSITHNGDFNNLVDANMFCQNLAEVAGRAGTYRAWLSTSTSSPNDDWEPVAACDVPYRRFDGVTVAVTWADLLDGTLQAPINVNENGVGSISSNVWTGTEIDGTVDGTLTCSNWNSSAAMGQGGQGGSNSASGSWTDGGSFNWCSTSSRIYCFEH